MNAVQEILPELFIDFDSIEQNGSASKVSTAKKQVSRVKRDGSAEREEMVRILSAQTNGKVDNKAVSSTVMSALYKKSGLGTLSGMLAAYNC